MTLPSSLPRTPSPAPLPARRSSRSRIVGSLTIGALALSFVLLGEGSVHAAEPRITVTPAAVPVGAIVVLGSGFGANTQVELAWGSTEVETTAVQANEDGTFETVLTIPRATPVGAHSLRALEHGPATGGTREAIARVSVVAEPSEFPAMTAKSEHLVDHGPLDTPDFDVRVPRPGPTEAQVVVDHTAHAAAAAATHEPGASEAPHDAGGGGGGAAHTAGTVHVAGDPIDCTGYAEPRTYMQIHTWWDGAPLPEGHIAHLHAESCVPLGQTVSGQVTFDTKITMHDNPGTLFRYETALFTDDDGGSISVVGLDNTCGLDQTCEWWVQTVVDTTAASDGWHELRFKPRVELSDGSVMLTSAGWPIYTENGNGEGGSRGGLSDIVGRGWYDNGHDYQNPVFRGPVETVVPGASVSGAWQPELRLDAGSGGNPVTFAAAYVDANFHHNDEDSDGGGVVLGEWDGPFRGTLPIDTSQFSNGPHDLILRVDAQQSDGRLVALQYVRFVVEN